MAATLTHTPANGRPLDDATPGLAAEGATDMRCPDPSAHRTKSSTLQDHASAAALYSTNPSRASARNPLGSDGKLSSASAAASLRHAQAQDLPSFPIVGIDTRTSAGTAAHLAHANFKSPEYPKAAASSSAAGKAALLAHNYKVAPLWQPETSAAGSKAALLAHKDGVKLNLWQPEVHADGHSAATIAMSRKGLGPQADWSSTEEGKKKALIAATGATSEIRRKRAQSNPAPPPTFPDQHNSARNALTAATLSHSASIKAKPQGAATTSVDSDRLGSVAMEAARIQHSKVSRSMYTSSPPVSLEIEQKRRQDALKASAISMAKKMYDVQQHDQTARSHANSGAIAAQNQQPSLGTEDGLKREAIRYIHIQEAAQKLAAERLAKLAPDETTQLRHYYGYDKPTRNKLSIRRGRNRAASNPEVGDSDSDEDDFRTRRIRSQMSQFNNNLALVDAKKREQDQKALIEAAQRKVQTQMAGMDQKVFDKTGKMSPAMIEEWDAKARARASANHEARMEHHGKVHLGSGKYMDQSEIDAIAQARMQPTLDEINEKTEKRLAQEEERRLEVAEQRRKQQGEKERAAEIKAEEKASRDTEKRALKAKSADEKAIAKQEKVAEKERRAEEKRSAKEEKRKSRDRDTRAEHEGEPVVVTFGAAIGTATVGTRPSTGTRVPTFDAKDDLYRDPTSTGVRSSTAEDVEPPGARASASVSHDEPNSPTSPISPTSPTKTKRLTGLFSKLKRRSKHSEPGFIGGATLRNTEAATYPTVSPHEAPIPTRIPSTNAERRHSDISSMSSDSDAGRGRHVQRTATQVSGISEYSEARDTFNENLAPPPAFTADLTGRNSGSPVRDSKFKEVL